MHEIPIIMLYSKVGALNVPCNRVGIKLEDGEFYSSFAFPSFISCISSQLPVHDWV